MPRTLPAALTTAMDSGVFKAYIAIGKRNYTAGVVSSYTTLITNILYYKYNGLELTVKWASSNLPADDGLIVGNKYYIERGITISGVNHTIKSASLRFNDYTIQKQIITGTFTLFSADERPDAFAGDVSYTTVLNALNPNAAIAGTTDFKDTPENANHWSYNFYATGKQVILKSYQSALALLRQKYLIEAVDNSDNTNEDEIQYYHLSSPLVNPAWRQSTGENLHRVAWSTTLAMFAGVNNTVTTFLYTSTDGINWTPRTIANKQWNSICWASGLSLFVAGAADGSIATSPDGITWTSRTSVAGTYFEICYSPELNLIAQVGTNIQTSPDGITWTSRTKPAGGNLIGICWSAGLSKFLAVGNSTALTAQSTDGITWTSINTTTNLSYVDWAPSLNLFVAVHTGTTYKSTTGSTWTSTTAPAGVLSKVHWIANLARFYAISYTNYTVNYSTDGTNWLIETTLLTATYQDNCYAPALSRLLIVSTTSTKQALRIEEFLVDHTIEQGDITLLKDAQVQSFLWRDEAGTIHTSGETTSTVHNLGYLESTDDPPASYENSNRATAIVGIHLKYKSGDVFALKINTSQTATYLAHVTEILDPNAEIGWRCQIELIERFSNTNGGAMPSTIERIASYTPLVTVNFNGNLDSTVNNLQAFADKVDDLTLGEVTQAELDAVAATIPTTEGIEDIVGAMVSSNTESGITVTYDDAGGKLNFDAQTAGDARYAPIAKGVTNGDAHTHSQHLDRTRNIPFPALTDTTAVIGSADTHGSLSQDLHFHLADGVTTTIKNLAGIPVPQDVVSGGTCNFVILWSSSAAGNNVNLTVICREVGSNDTAHTNLVASTANYAANANADKVQRTAISMTAPTPGKSISFAVLRNGTNAGDTNTGTMSLWGVFCEYTADM